MYSNGYDQSALRTYTGDIRQWCSRLYVRRHRNITPTYWTAGHWHHTTPRHHRYRTVLFFSIEQIYLIWIKWKHPFVVSNLLSKLVEQQIFRCPVGLIHSLLGFPQQCVVICYLIVMQVRSIYYLPMIDLSCPSLSDSLKWPPTNKFKLVKTML